MKTQILMVVIYSLNLILLWLMMRLNKFAWYKVPGTLILFLLPFFSVLPDQPKFELDYFWWIVGGYIALILGLLLIIWAKYQFGKVFVWIGFNPKKLINSGPYKFVRHPMYLGLIFVFVGWWWVWAAVYAFYFGMFILALLWLQAYLEEKLMLEKIYGKEYDAYRKVIGMFWIK